MTALHPAPRQRVAGLLAAVLMAATFLSACGGEDTTRKPSSLEDKVRVSGEFGEKPTLTIAAPLKVPSSQSWTQGAGEGDEVGPESTAILQLTLADGTTGKTVISTFDQGQRPLEASLSDQIFPSLVKALDGARSGSRVVVASTAEDAYGEDGAPQIGIKAGVPVVMVADVLSTDPISVLPGPTGATTAPPAAAPRILEGAGGPTGFDFSGLRKPRKAQVFTLREGDGRTLDGPRRIASDYMGVVWGGKEPFDTSYPKEPAKFSVGTGGVIPCWDKGLAGAKAGARVLLVCPPATAYGAAAQPGIPANSTLVFVVDVLGVG